MSRKMIFAYTLVFFGAVLATMSFTAPALMGGPLALAVIFLPLLAVGLALHYALRNRSRFARGILNAFLIAAALYALTGMGAPGWGIFAAVLMVAALASIKGPVKTPADYGRPATPAHTVETAARNVILPWNEGRRVS